LNIQNKKRKMFYLSTFIDFQRQFPFYFKRKIITEQQNLNE